MKVFIVPGYHLPKDLSQDEVYKKYFNFVCLEIKKTCDSKDKILVILSGGNIDMDEPFDRVLSIEMKMPFLDVAGKHDIKCEVLTEVKSLSSIENLIYSKEIVDNIEEENDIFVFSDLQRSNRTKLTADKIFSKFHLLTIDLSSDEEKNNQEIVNKKEALALNFSLWALESLKNLEEFKKIYIDKFKLLRSVPPEKRKETEILWWKSMISKYQDKLIS